MLRLDVPARRAKSSTGFASNMAYRVELTDRAARDLELLYLEKNAAESQAAARWHNRLEEASSPLERYPYRLRGRGTPLIEPQIGEESRLTPDDGYLTIQVRITKGTLVINKKKPDANESFAEAWHTSQREHAIFFLLCPFNYAHLYI